MSKIIVELSIIPLGEGTSLSKWVASALKVLKTSNLLYQLTPMGTIIEGEYSEVMKVIREMHEIQFTLGARRVLTTIKIDDRRDATEFSMGHKLKAVEDKINEM